MADETVSATTIINAPAEAIFAVLADPAKHAAIDGTGWVREPVDSQPLTAAGQVFRMAMYHANHPDGNYLMASRVQVFELPRAISWEPGQETGDGSLRFGGWVWRYDLAPAGPSRTTVTLSYDWSAVSSFLRQHIGFPRPSGSSGQLAVPPRRPGRRVTGQQDRQAPARPSGLARPARQALAAAGYVTLEQLTQVTEADLARMHGIGPKAVSQLRDAFAAAGLSFATGN
jgi:uncharacterized protein YndB with AHSA1/START domain